MAGVGPQTKPKRRTKPERLRVEVLEDRSAATSLLGLEGVMALGAFVTSPAHLYPAEVAPPETFNATAADTPVRDFFTPQGDVFSSPMGGAARHELGDWRPADVDAALAAEVGDVVRPELDRLAEADSLRPRGDEADPFAAIQPLHLDAPFANTSMAATFAFDSAAMFGAAAALAAKSSAEPSALDPSAANPRWSPGFSRSANPETGTSTTLASATSATTDGFTDGSSFFTMAPGGKASGGGSQAWLGGGSQMMLSSTDTLWVMDWNDGLTLGAGAHEFDHESAQVDLRVQTTKPVTSISWNTSQAPDARNITGASTYRLQFNWASLTQPPAADHTNTISVTVNFADSTQQVQTYTFKVMPDDGASSVPTWGTVLTPDTVNGNDRATAVGGDYHAVLANSGVLVTSHAPPGYGPGSANLGLAYDSEQAAPKPIFLLRYEINPAQAVPPTVSAKLTLNGTTYQEYFFTTSNLIPGDVMQIALQGDATGLATGRYDWSIAAVAHYTGGDVTTNASGKVNIINRASSPYGAGWRVDGLNQLYAVTGGVMLDVGDHALWFAASGGNYTSPAGDFSTLVLNGDSTYTRTLKSGVKENYSSAGLMTSIVDLSSNTVTFGYTSGLLSSITDANSRVTTYAYTGGYLTSITDPASRATTFSYTSGKLTGATDPDSAAWAYAYNTDGRMTSITDPRSKVTSFAYGTAGRVATVTRADTISAFMDAYALQGWVAAGSGTSGAPATAVLWAAAAASYTDGRSNVTNWRMDWRGFGIGATAVDPVGYWDVIHYDTNGLAHLATDRLNRNTALFRDSKGNVTTLRYADWTSQTYTYNTSNRVTQFKDESNNTYTYTYNTTTQNLLTETDPASRVITYTYTTDGKVETVTDQGGRVTTNT